MPLDVNYFIANTSLCPQDMKCFVLGHLIIFHPLGFLDRAMCHFVSIAVAVSGELGGKSASTNFRKDLMNMETTEDDIDDDMC
eukprot:scaffold11287_cov59-Cyclotella_meneghiniana.AAC.3